MKRVRGLKSLVHDAVDLTLDLVEEGHESVARNAMRVFGLIEPLAEPARKVDAIRRAATAGVLDGGRLLNRLIQRGTDPALAVVLAQVAARDQQPEPVPLRCDIIGSAAWNGDAALGVLNAVVGDYLHVSDNPLSIPMELRFRDAYLDPPAIARAVTSRRLAILVHGLGTTEWGWCMHGDVYHGDPSTHFGQLLERDLGVSPILARYNTGRHISENGRALADQLEALIDGMGDVDELALIGHSMGGLIVRSACYYGQQSGHRWIDRVRDVVSLGSPHHGAPLEKLGNILGALLSAVDLPGTRIPARILRGRSAGIKDLRYGNVVDEDWLGRDPDAWLRDARTSAPLCDHITYHFVSATITRDPDHPFGQLIGDLLVRVPSASGPSGHPFPIHTRRYGGVMHHQLQNHPDVYLHIRDALVRPTS